MADPANDFIRDYQSLAQQSWDAWTRQLQQQQPQPAAANPFFTSPTAATSGNDTLERTLAGLKGYFDWMQGAALNGAAAQPVDWRQQLQQLFGGASQPFAQAFGGIDSAGAEGFARQWQSWMQAAQHGGFGDLPGAHGPTPAFGQDREQQMKQQAMAAAVLESLQASARYQALIQRSNAQAMQRLQDKLAERAEPGRQIDSLKALYDLWVDAAEEAYAEIALTDEFREVYGNMVNTQMRVRQMQQQQTEQFCQQLGMPTRSEVSSLGERLQALRREFRASQATATEDRADEIMALRRELSALKRQVANGAKVAPVVKKVASIKRSTSAVKKSVSKTPAKVRTTVAGKAKPAAASKSRPSPRKRK
ncbi:poly(R)-hydroxyalkanoic acid synthase subunit PhaE [Rhodanobacter sp. T12-5]|uniref:poly(R)-hydroxyalkanoic acid synthase subunit PhaE n=1 Tax=Rhodanobacter sp. T12-5 TaxID=2024611 RepID=UPI0011EF4D49|nr:poly(R)-hydroxyalkanoic acid synthase subunit PhaE [Rhodanobacter sp. T12-5]KAA0068768.1 pha synthase subunit protein [Rhodanobacter sp. T12-5]